MNSTEALRIGIIGDFDAARPTHAATDEALIHAARSVRVDVAATWLPTVSLRGRSANDLGSFAGFFVAPGSPYRSIDGALRAIQWARENRAPLLGTCGGFQHVVLEFARNVLGLRNAHHAEYLPHGTQLVIEPLACSLAGQRASVFLVPGSRVASLYAAKVITEEYRCSFGLAAGYDSALARFGLSVCGRDANGEARVIELDGHPFFVAALFVPQLCTAPEKPHPLFRAFVQACFEARGAHGAA